ncbi:MAG: putative collagen-binding domain-containing protein [Nitrospiria bacterium]
MLDGAGAGKRIDAHQVREAAYWAVLAGAAGHGYGNNNIYQFFDEGSQKPTYKIDTSFPFSAWRGTIHWRKAMDFEGAYNMGLERRLFELRPWYKMVPDQSIIALGQGEGEDHIQAARAEDGSFIVAYSPFGHRIGVHMDKLSGAKIKAQWYDPREGTWILIGQFSNTGVREFVPPSNGDQNDWVLVLEVAEKNYPVEL